MIAFSKCQTPLDFPSYQTICTSIDGGHCLSHCSNKYKLAREGEKDKGKGFFFFLLEQVVSLFLFYLYLYIYFYVKMYVAYVCVHVSLCVCVCVCVCVRVCVRERERAREREINTPFFLAFYHTTICDFITGGWPSRTVSILQLRELCSCCGQ